MKAYEAPEMKVSTIEAADVVATSVSSTPETPTTSSTPGYITSNEEGGALD